MISLIILAYNDGASLQEIIPEWIKVLKQQERPFEIIVTDDGSTDDTVNILQKIVAAHPCVKYVRSENNYGVGANFRNGIEHAGGELIAYTDGDGQYLPEDLLLLLEKMEEYHLVTGRRIKRADPFIRTVTSAIYNKLVRVIYPVSVRDVNSGLKIFRRSYIESCFPQFSDGPFFDAEYLIKGKKNGMQIKEIPIGHRKRKYGKAGGISTKNLRMLFGDLCHQPMKPFTRRNYLSKFIFRLFVSS